MADIIGQVKASCLASLEHSGIAFDDAGQRAFLEQLDEADWKKHFEVRDNVIANERLPAPC
jgi:hypothetical protein